MARAVVGSGKTLEFEALVGATLSSLDPSSPKSEAVAYGMLSKLRRNEQVDITRTACLLLQQKKFIEPALIYLGYRGRSQAHMDCVKNANPGPQFDVAKRMPLQVILTRQSTRP